MKTLITVTGPTAVGKTRVAVNLARHFDAEVVNADSRQFYREMSVGTAKPTKEELGGVSHHLLDFLSINRHYSAGQYEKDALRVLEAVFSRKSTAILVGGSGMYVKAVCEGLDDLPQVPEEIRHEVNELFLKEGLSVLVEELKEKDPDHFQMADLKNHRRVMRALEIIRASGKPFSHFKNRKMPVRPFRIVKMGLDMERRLLYDRIDLRVEEMVEQGLFEEATSLFPFCHCNALQTVGYREVFDFLNGLQNKADTVDLIKRNTRRYAKRQLTWFRKDAHIQWFHPDDWEGIMDFLSHIPLKDRI